MNKVLIALQGPINKKTLSCAKTFLKLNFQIVMISWPVKEFINYESKDLKIDFIDDPGTIVIPIGEFPNVPQVDGIFEYHGPGMFILDPVEGSGTKFTKELFVNDIIELQKEEKLISGKFFTNGKDYVYYSGQEFINKFNNN